ncbi:matrixin family metalloprotease [Enterococcus sp. AZ163]|uniref:matrixin family metalloprotease n=1 Tax=Enterococcus sp. AZ163 TaxID=2774638 RepID=UPI003D2DE047
MNKLKKISAVFLLSSICFIGTTNVNAKSVDIAKTSIIEYQYPGLSYGTTTSVNEYGTIIYDSSLLGEDYQLAVKEAAQSWNQAVGRMVIVEKSIVNATDSQIDLVLQSTEEDSYADMGYSGIGWGNSISRIFLNTIALSDSLSGKGTAGYVQLVSTVRHEMGHILGLQHDNGAVMADLYDAETNNNQEMLVAAQKTADSISKGILPAVPLFNKYAILNILNNRSQIYYLNNHRSNQIASIFLDSPGGKISGVTFINLTCEIVRNYNLYKLSLSPADPYIGTTFSRDFMNKTVTVTEDIVSVYGNHYYLFEVDGEEYIVNSRAFE